MTPKHLHNPVSTRLRCPICHQAVYSRAGIHPQCAMSQSDPPKVRGGVRRVLDPAAEAVAVATAIPAEVPAGPVLAPGSPA